MKLSNDYLNRNRMKSIISYVFSFLLTVLLVVFYLCAGFNLGVFDNKSVTKAIYESHYYQRVYDELYQELEQVVTEAGFPAEVLMDAITQERVYIGSKNYVDRALRGEEPVIKTEKLKNQLRSNVEAYLKQENIIRTQELDNDLTKLIAVIEENYKEAIQLKLARDIAGYRMRYERMFGIVLSALVILIGGICVCLVKLHRYRHKGVRFIVYSLLTSSVMTMAVAFILVKTRQYARIDVNPEHYKNLVTSYLRWDMMIFLYLGGIGLTVAVALATYVYYLKSRIAFQ